MQSVGGKLNFKEIVMSYFPFVSYESSRAVPDADLEIRGGGGGLPKKLFRPFWPQFGPKNNGGEVGPPGPSPESTTAGANVHSIRRKSPALSS